MANKIVCCVAIAVVVIGSAVRVGAQKLTRRPNQAVLVLSAPKISHPIKLGEEDPGCESGQNMGQLLDSYLQKALAASDGVGDDSTWSGTSASNAVYQEGLRTYSLYATCRVFAVSVPVPPGTIKEIRTVMHVDGKANGDDNVCHPLRVRKQGSGWILEALPPYPTAWKVGCSGGYSNFGTLKVLQARDGKSSVVGAVFKNWSNDTMRTGQLIIEW